MDAIDCSNSQQQFMLVDNVKLVQVPKRSSNSSSVCLGARDRFFHTRVKKLFYSFKSGLEYLGVLTDREVSVFQNLRIAGMQRNQVIHQMVESRSDGVNGIPSCEGNVNRDGSNIGDLKNAISSVNIVLGRDWICAPIKKPLPNLLEIEDVYFGPS